MLRLGDIVVFRSLRVRVSSLVMMSWCWGRCVVVICIIGVSSVKVSVNIVISWVIVVWLICYCWVMGLIRLMMVSELVLKMK